MLKKLRRMIPLFIRREILILKRFIQNRLDRKVYAVEKINHPTAFSVPVFSHRASLFRDYPEPWYSLQKRKVENLFLAVKKFDSLVLKKGGFFSFWKILGRPLVLKGYQKGMVIQNGKLAVNDAGGLCQLSNAFLWTALHLGFSIVERHRHSFDFFPDSRRNVPFGIGATILYNYKDLVFQNQDSIDYLFKVYLSDEFLHIDVFASEKPLFSYQIEEKDHRYLLEGEKKYRSNRIVQKKINQKGETVEEKTVLENKGLVLYDIE
ncbi:MAG TPA: vancomycin resistance protein [Spirochaetia bacterium]|nr:vancomycin resistance protein [Spirochaetia bacterium]